MLFDLRLEWVRDLHQRPVSTTSFTCHGIIVPERHSRLVRLDAGTGQVLWEATIENQWGWLAVTETRVVYLNPSGFLQSFDLDTRASLWERNLAGQYGGHLVAGERCLITGGWRGYTDVTCLDIASGEIVWINPVKDQYACPIVSTWGICLARVVSNQVKTIQLLDYERGQIQFELDIPENVRASDTAVSIQLAGGMLYATTEQGEIYSLGFGEERWTLLAEYREEISTITPSNLNNCLLFQDRDQQLCCFDMGKRQLKWRHPLDHKGADRLSAAQHEDLVFVGTSEGQLMAFDDLGSRVFARRVGKRVLTDIFVTDAGGLILGTEGTIRSFSRVTEANSKC